MGFRHVILSMILAVSAGSMLNAQTEVHFWDSQPKQLTDRYDLAADYYDQGLGLNICKTIADKLGAVVTLDTSYKNGARFLLIMDNEQKTDN